MTQYMLLFSLGPVQSFITQARKTRDLWLGSFLLSALMQASMQTIPKSNLIFPHNPRIEGTIPDLPNKYIAIFNTLVDAEQTAEQSRKDIITSWSNICNDVWTGVLAKSTISSLGTRQQWENQINPANVFDIFWVAVEGDEQRYGAWLTETQYMFDRRKHLRDFQQQVESGEKSTISGQRAALRGVGEERTDVQTFWYLIARKQYPRDISQDGTERLDAIDTVKRFAHLSDHLAQLVYHQNSQSIKAGFPSVSSIATASFVEQLIPASEDEKVSPELTSWFKASKALNDKMPATIPLLNREAKDRKHGSAILERDGDCYFPETFSARRLEKEFGFDNQRKGEREQLAQDGPEAVDRLLRATDTLMPTISRPTPYYAMIQMDGDKMGRLINGVFDKQEHQDISYALSRFSRENVPTLVESSYPGKLIYAGGDDVFAIAPLARDSIEHLTTYSSQANKTLLTLIYQLQEQYRSIVSEAVKDAPKTDATSLVTPRKQLVTASTGVAIAHHYTSLSYMRRVSKEAEQLAKNHYGRNALVVTVLRRSGEQTRVGCHWQYAGLANEAQPIPLFSFFYGLFVNDVLSPKCVHTLLEEAPTLVALEEDAQVSEIKRVLLRQRNPMQEKHFPDEMLKVKAKQLFALAHAMDTETMPDKKGSVAVELHAEGRRYGLVEVLGWLLVMLFLTRKEHE